MASPQVCGLGALYLQMNPGVNPESLKKWFANTTGVSGVIYTSGLGNDYTNLRSILGGDGKIAYNPFAIASDSNLTGAITLNNGAVTLT
jgi:hypothetical protein